MTARSFLSIHDLSAREVSGLFELTAKLKSNVEPYRDLLRGKSLAMIFQKSSTRTRVSFEVGMHQLGGQALFLSARDLQLGRGETIADTARVLSRYCDAIMARTYEHTQVVELAEHATVPVINGLTDLLHPCQALADYFTMWEIFGDLKGRKLGYVGDGNNVAHSLILGAPKVGVDVSVATPKGFEPKAEIVRLARADAAAGVAIEIVRDPFAAVDGAVAVYTDVWASMGQESEAEARSQAFQGYTVSAEVMSKAHRDAVFLHCLPCHRGEEVDAEVVDGRQSRVFDQAENRLHVQKALLLWLMGAAELTAT